MIIQSIQFYSNLLEQKKIIHDYSNKKKLFMIIRIKLI